MFPMSLQKVALNAAQLLVTPPRSRSLSFSDLTPCGIGVVRLVSSLANSAAEYLIDPSPDLSSGTFSDRLEQLQKRCADILRLARYKLHTYPYHAVPIYWLRLFTDASILSAVFYILKGDTDAAVIIEVLDLAIIMAGACGPSRREAIDEI